MFCFVAGICFLDQSSHTFSGAAETEDYVRYLLEGSGAEHNIDFSKLRRELEIPTPSVSRVLDLQSFNTVESPGNILSSAGTPREDRTQVKHKLVFFGLLTIPMSYVHHLSGIGQYTVCPGTTGIHTGYPCQYSSKYGNRVPETTNESFSILRRIGQIIAYAFYSRVPAGI